MNFLIFFVVVLFLSFGNIFAQNIPGVPNGSANSDSRDEIDNGIRLRSFELERIKRESYRSAIAEKAAKKREINYSQIKEDFEMIQKLQNEIIKTYVTGKQINYGRISLLASKLNKCAERLDENLSLSEEKSDNEIMAKISDPVEVKDLIVVIDKSVGKFVTNPIFKNLKIIETENAVNAEFHLQNIIRLSDFLVQKAEAQK